MNLRRKGALDPDGFDFPAAGRQPPDVLPAWVWMFQTRCEWGKDDYSLKVENLPPAPPPEGQQDLL